MVLQKIHKGNEKGDQMVFFSYSLPIQRWSGKLDSSAIFWGLTKNILWLP